MPNAQFLSMSLSIADLEKVQTSFTDAHLDYKMELVDGKIIVMGLSDYLSGEVIARLVAFLNIWVLPRKLGRVVGSNAGFWLPDGNLRGPDVSFVPAAKMPRSPRSFAKIVPDLMVEVRRSTDNIRPLTEKIQRFLELGTQVGILVDTKNLNVTVYRSSSEPIVLSNEDTLTLPELLPGWELSVAEIWSPVFEEQE